MKVDKTQFIKIYIDETTTYLNILDQGLVELEKNPEKRELIDELFRAAHTLKGSARMMGYSCIRDVSHKIEDLFSLIVDKKIQFNSGIADVLFHALDVIKEALQNITQGKTENVETQKICEQIEEVCQGKEVIVEKKSHEKSLETKTDKTTQDAKRVIEAPEQKNVQQTKVEEVSDTTREGRQEGEYVRVPIGRINHLLNLIGEMVINKVNSVHKIPVFKQLSHQAISVENLFSEIKIMLKDHLNIPDELIQNKGTLIRASQENEEDLTIMGRFHAAEAIVNRLSSRLVQLFEDLQQDIFHINPVIEEIQQQMKELRMLPCSTVFETMPRLVRDIAREQGKKVTVDIRGQETELDKKVMDGIKGPLIHVLRNSIDHGVEAKEERVKLGKKEVAKITVSAFQEGAMVVITVEDDGKGIDLIKVGEAALKKGIVNQKELEEMSDSEKYNLLFAEGFSTAPIITDISGRGVGLDVVRTEIEKLKGSVAISSKKNEGTQVKIELPLTIAIIKVLLVTAGKTKLALPMNGVVHTLKVKPQEISTIENRMVMQYEGQSLPVVSLAEVLGISSENREIIEEDEYVEDTKKSSETVVVVVQSMDKKVGFIVDRIISEEEVFIKNLGDFFGKIKCVNGATILADGRLVLILDIQDLVLVAKAAHPSLRPRPKKDQMAAVRVLLVEDSMTTRELEKTILEDKGYKVDTAIDGLDAMEKLSVNEYDIIVSDIIMPRMNGLDLCSTLKRDEKYENIPFIFVTSLASEEEKRRGIEAGGQAYIVKQQFDQNNLLETIERLV